MKEKINTLVIGANGKVGRLIIKSMVNKKIPCKAMIRNLDQSDFFSDLGVKSVVADLNDDLNEAMSDCNRVIFAAGSGAAAGAASTMIVDLWGSLNVIKQAENNKINNFIMISSLKSCTPLKGPEKIQHYLIARHLADKRFLESDIKEKIIIRPARLLDDMGTGKITSKFNWSDNTNAITTITRIDLVEFIIKLIDKPVSEDIVIDLVNGDIDTDVFIEAYC